MNEQLALIRGYLHMLWLYRWSALLVASVISVVGWFVVLTLPNQYEVSAKIFLDTRSMLRPLLKGLAVDSNVLQDSALLMRKTLVTRPNLEEVARRTDMDHSAETPQAFDSMISGLAEDIKITGGGRRRTDNIFTITYKHAEPEMAKRVVEELLNTFMESALGATRKDTAVTEKFLDNQIEDYEKKLIAAEERLKDFKRKNAGLMPTEGRGYYVRIESLEVQLSQAQLELREAKKRQEKIKNQIADVEEAMSQPIRIDSPDVMLTPLQQRIVGMEEKLDQLLLQYTDRHPDVEGTRRVLEDLKGQQESLEKVIAEDPLQEKQQLVENKLYQDLTVELSKAEGEIGALSERSKEYKRRLEILKQQADTIPQIEAELKQLDRDYGLNKQQYDELIKRRESARISKDADQSVDDIQLNIIDPPRVPLIPVGPKRLQFLGLVFLAALGAGGGLAWLLAQMKPRVFTSQSLKELTGLPIIGTISLSQSRWETSERRMEFAVYSLVFMLLLGCFSALMFMEFMQMDLHGYVTKITQRLI